MVAGALPRGAAVVNVCAEHWRTPMRERRRLLTAGRVDVLCWKGSGDAALRAPPDAVGSPASGVSMLDVVIEPTAIRVGPRFALAFQRTLRIPDDGRTYPLPPGLGALPVHDARDYADRVPRAWRDERAAFIPMYQREALWLSFAAAPWKPNAVVVEIGGVNAVSGEVDATELTASPQSYVVCPPQLWLDGINSGQGVIRQFVAMPLGRGYTVEASVAGRESVGGMRITVLEPRPGLFPDEEPPRARPAGGSAGAPLRAASAAASRMGLGAGGVMRQKIYPDPHGVDAWSRDDSVRVVVHVVNSEQFAALVGREPPPPPIDAATYARHGLPWFDLYDETRGDVAPPAPLSRATTVAERERERGEEAEELGVDLSGAPIVKLPHDAGGRTPGGAAPPARRRRD